MAEMASATHVSVPSIKEWRRGGHAPSDLGKVRDIAAFLGVDVEELLIVRGEAGEMGGRDVLADGQVAAFCRVYREVVDFFEVMELSDELVWHDYDLRGFPPRLVEDVVPSPVYPPSAEPEGRLLYGEWGVLACDLHAQLALRVRRTLRVERALLGRTTAYAGLDEIVSLYVEDYPYDEDDRWVPDPELSFEPPYVGSATPMGMKAAKGLSELEALASVLLP